VHSYRHIWFGGINRICKNLVQAFF
jgi:hypothetical protein